MTKDKLFFSPPEKSRYLARTTDRERATSSHHHVERGNGKEVRVAHRDAFKRDRHVEQGQVGLFYVDFTTSVLGRLMGRHGQVTSRNVPFAAKVGFGQVHLSHR